MGEHSVTPAHLGTGLQVLIPTQIKRKFDEPWGGDSGCIDGEFAPTDGFPYGSVICTISVRYDICNNLRDRQPMDGGHIRRLTTKRRHPQAHASLPRLRAGSPEARSSGDAYRRVGFEVVFGGKSLGKSFRARVNPKPPICAWP